MIRVRDEFGSWEYRAVGNRCAVDLTRIKPGQVSIYDALDILHTKGFKVLSQNVPVDIVELARRMVGRATYKRGAQVTDWSQIFDCSGLAKWLYGQFGIWLPRRSIQQFQYGIDGEIPEIKPGDLIFTTGFKNYSITLGDEFSIGHVGICTGHNTVIHAANSKRGVVEDPQSDFTAPEKFRALSRFLPDEGIFSFETPPGRNVEVSEDFFWILCQSLG